MNTQTILENVRDLSGQFAANRAERQRRRALDPHDLDRLAEAGFLHLALPVEQGGVWEGLPSATRPICEALRALARADSSLALVCSMHPVVLALWLATPEAPRPYQRAWRKQRQRVFQTAADGAWWGTITSESGSGGDIARTKAVARCDRRKKNYLLCGHKHFGTGLGALSFMITTAVPEGEEAPDWFFMDLRDVAWDGSAGLKLLGEWDGHGMLATQSHSMLFEDYPLERFAWPKNLTGLGAARDGFELCAFSSVFVGIVDVALRTAREQLRPWHASLDAYRQVEWSKVETEGWLIQQAYEGMLRAVETQSNPRRAALHAKLAIAELAESVLRRIVRIVGGGTYSRRSPFGFWYADVRALGFLRPPWGLAYDRLPELIWDEGE